MGNERKNRRNIEKLRTKNIFRHMTGVTWKDRLSSEEVAKRCKLNELQGK